MTAFKVRIQEVREVSVEVDAANEKDALKKVKSAIDEDKVDLGKLHPIKHALAVEKDSFEFTDIREIVV